MPPLRIIDEGVLVNGKKSKRKEEESRNAVPVNMKNYVRRFRSLIRFV